MDPSVTVTTAAGVGVWFDLYRTPPQARPAAVAAAMSGAFGPGRLSPTDRPDCYRWEPGEAA